MSSPVGSLPQALDPASKKPATLPGVVSAAGLFRVQTPIGPRNLQIQFVAIDAAPYAGIVAGTPGDPDIPPEMLAAQVPNGVVPLLVSQSLVDRTDGAPLGATQEVIIEGYHYQVMPIAARATYPTLKADTTFAIASRQQLRSIHPEAQMFASTVLLDAPDASLPAIRDAVSRISASATVDSQAANARAFTDSPVTAAIVVGIAVAALVAAVYAALAVTAALALAGASRAIEVAHLRMIGMSRRDALGLALIEHGPTVVLAFAAGVALGIGLFALLEPGLGLDSIVGSRIAVPLTADPAQLAVIAAAVLGIAAVGIGLAAWMQRRGVAVLALRRGFE